MSSSKNLKFNVKRFRKNLELRDSGNDTNFDWIKLNYKKRLNLLNFRFWV